MARRIHRAGPGKTAPFVEPGHELSFAVQWFGLIDQHDGNIIPNFVDKFASITDEPVSAGIQPDFAFAFRASQDFEQFLAERHIGSLSSLFRL
jgi:hypothetical protein